MTAATRIRLDSFGGPEVMTLEQVDLPAPAAGEAQVRQTAVGFNYIDVYQRSGIYPLPTPTGLGHEAAGVVEAVGAGVTGLKPGDRVAYINAGIGAYADRRIVPADKLVPVPDGVSDEAAAALIFKGLTAQYLIRKTHNVGPGDTILVHAAAGGVGQILSAWAKALGATVIGTAGGPEKVAIAKAAGCDVAIDYRQEDWPEQVLAATSGKKVRVAYDSVGEATFLKTLDLIAPFGLMVSFGAASGPAPAIGPELLNKKGCLFLTRPSIFPHNADPAVLKANAAELFAAISAGIVKPAIAARFPLAEAVEAHRTAEARTTAGSILLIP
ncbi:quinone oxidoreductase [Azorhizobium oxalatiphilum]|uniref:Quinone oxidoreductase n=1 Tax=Azorhizobium oxalatiphilum TaxID=980631 RepID=A0A917BI62_9HYPH|nr:quinone oxidoreductase [Azorhizobium oxalatiphilum]GGF45705.1 quinone oxidoreductase [Azorhizobium oxalatiphilum]